MINIINYIHVFLVDPYCTYCKYWSNDHYIIYFYLYIFYIAPFYSCRYIYILSSCKYKKHWVFWNAPLSNKLLLFLLLLYVLHILTSFPSLACNSGCVCSNKQSKNVVWKEKYKIDILTLYMWLSAMISVCIVKFYIYKYPNGTLYITWYKYIFIIDINIWSMTMIHVQWYLSRM